MILASLFEGLDLLDLWHLYGQIKRVSDVRKISISKVSRCSRAFLDDLGLHPSEGRGAPDPQLLRHSGSLAMLRRAFQEWRIERGCLKVLPTFSASVALRELTQQLDVLPDVFLSAEQIADHLLERRIDLILSSSLDLAGELIQEAQSDADSPFLAIPLFEDPVLLALNPAHPLAGLRAAASDDCRCFPSAGYPDGIARLAAEALRARGLWRLAARRQNFDASEWMLSLRSPTGLCYQAAFLSQLLPETRELHVMPFAQPLYQTNCVLMLRELAARPALEAVLDQIRSCAFRSLLHCHHEINRC